MDFICKITMMLSFMIAGILIPTISNTIALGFVALSFCSLGLFAAALCLGSIILFCLD